MASTQVWLEGACCEQQKHCFRLKPRAVLGKGTETRYYNKMLPPRVFGSVYLRVEDHIYICHPKSQHHEPITSQCGAVASVQHVWKTHDVCGVGQDSPPPPPKVSHFPSNYYTLQGSASRLCVYLEILQRFCPLISAPLTGWAVDFHCLWLEAGHSCGWWPGARHRPSSTSAPFMGMAESGGGLGSGLVVG